MSKDFNKLSNLIDQEITIESVGKSTFKMWDSENNKMLTSETYQKDYRKVYQVDTDKGILDISAHQIGQMLEGVHFNGVANLIDKTFKVKSNGQTGMEIRYYINPVHVDTVKVAHPITDQAQPSIEDDLPF